jgi:hypothetical protein
LISRARYAAEAKTAMLSAVLPLVSLELSRSRDSGVFGTRVEGDRRVWRGLVDDVYDSLE